MDQFRQVSSGLQQRVQYHQFPGETHPPSSLVVALLLPKGHFRVAFGIGGQAHSSHRTSATAFPAALCRLRAVGFTIPLGSQAVNKAGARAKAHGPMRTQMSRVEGQSIEWRPASPVPPAEALAVAHAIRAVAGAAKSGAMITKRSPHADAAVCDDQEVASNVKPQEGRQMTTNEIQDCTATRGWRPE